METLLNLLIIQFITVFIVDISGVVDSIKTGIKWILTKGKMKDSDYRLKPFDCSICMTFWSGLIYLICTSEFTFINIAIVCALAALTMETKNLILLVKDLISTIYKIIYKLIIDRL